MARLIKNLPAVQEMQTWSLGWEDIEMVTHSKWGGSLSLTHFRWVHAASTAAPSSMLVCCLWGVSMEHGSLMSPDCRSHVNMAARLVGELAKIPSSWGAEEPHGENTPWRQKEPGRTDFRSQRLFPLFISGFGSLFDEWLSSVASQRCV